MKTGRRLQNNLFVSSFGRAKILLVLSMAICLAGSSAQAGLIERCLVAVKLKKPQQIPLKTDMMNFIETFQAELKELDQKTKQKIIKNESVKGAFKPEHLGDPQRLVIATNNTNGKQIYLLRTNDNPHLSLKAEAAETEGTNALVVFVPRNVSLYEYRSTTRVSAPGYGVFQRTKSKQKYQADVRLFLGLLSEKEIQANFKGTSNGEVTVQETYSLSSGEEMTLTYTVYANGVFEFAIQGDALARIKFGEKKKESENTISSIDQAIQHWRNQNVGGDE